MPDNWCSLRRTNVLLRRIDKDELLHRWTLRAEPTAFDWASWNNDFSEQANYIEKQRKSQTESENHSRLHLLDESAQISVLPALSSGASHPS